MKTRRIIVTVLAFALLFALTGCKAGDYKKAVKAYDAGDYETAAELFEELGDFKASGEMLEKCKYEAAVQYAQDGDYSRAVELFWEIEDYLDSAQQAKYCVYMQACQLEEGGDCLGAAAKFDSLGDYEDSAARADECREKYGYEMLEMRGYDSARIVFETIKDEDKREDGLNECDYRIACDYLESGDYSAAEELFTQLGNYKDSAAKAKEAEEKIAMGLIAGRWTVSYDMGDGMGELLAIELELDIPDGTFTFPVDTVLTLNEDGTFTLEVDTEKLDNAIELFAESLAEYLYDYLEDLLEDECVKKGTTLEALYKANGVNNVKELYEKQTGKTLEKYIEEKLDTGKIKSMFEEYTVYSGTYTADSDSIVFTCGGKEYSAGFTVDGDTMTLHADFRVSFIFTTLSGKIELKRG